MTATARIGAVAGAKAGAARIPAWARRLGALACGAILFGGTVAWHEPPAGESSGGRGDRREWYSARVDGPLSEGVLSRSDSDTPVRPSSAGSDRGRAGIVRGDPGRKPHHLLERESR